MLEFIGACAVEIASVFADAGGGRENTAAPAMPAGDSVAGQVSTAFAGEPGTALDPTPAPTLHLELPGQLDGKAEAAARYAAGLLQGLLPGVEACVAEPTAVLAAPIVASPMTETGTPEANGGLGDGETQDRGKGKGKSKSNELGKAKGKGKTVPGPPPKLLPSVAAAKAVSKAKAAAKAAAMSDSGVTGMAQLLGKVEATGAKKDREEASQIEDVDFSLIDPSARRERVKCLRCEKEVDTEQLESHMTSHSSEILPWLFLGGVRNAENIDELTKRTGITHILNLARECNLWENVIGEPIKQYNAKRGLGFSYKKYPFGDSPDQDLLQELPGALEFIHNAKEASPEHHVLVHCVQGISRSALGSDRLPNEARAHDLARRLHTYTEAPSDR